MTKQEFLKLATEEIVSLRQANYYYWCTQLVENITYLQNAVNAVSPMTDRVFASWWRVMHLDFDFLKKYCDQDDMEVKEKACSGLYEDCNSECCVFTECELYNDLIDCEQFPITDDDLF